MFSKKGSNFSLKYSTGCGESKQQISRAVIDQIMQADEIFPDWKEKVLSESKMWGEEAGI